VLVWFRLGILAFILITVLCGIPDRLSSDCFWAHPLWRDVGGGGCGRLSASGYLVCLFQFVGWKSHAESWCICCCDRSRNVYDV